MADFILSDDNPFVEDLKDSIGLPEKTTEDIIMAALTLFQWAVQEAQNNRTIFSSDQAGEDISQFEMEELQAATLKASTTG